MIVRIDVNPFVFATRSQNMFAIGTEIQSVEGLWDRRAGDLVECLRLDRDDLVFTVSAVEDRKLVACRACEHVDRKVTEARLLALRVDRPSVG